MDFNERLTYLGEVLISLSSSPVPSHQFQAIADHANVVLPCNYLAVCLRDPEEQGYFIHSLSGQAMGAIPFRLFDLEEGIAGQVIHSGRPITTKDLENHPHQTADMEGVLSKFGLQSAFVCPIRRGEETLGAMYFAAAPPHIYTKEDKQVGSLLADGLSASLETSRLYQRLADEHSMMTAFLGSAADAALVINPQGIILLMNPAAGKMFNLDPEALIGKPLFEMVDSPKLLELFTAEEETNPTREIALPNNRVAQGNRVAVMTPFGEHIGFAAILRDITLLKELENMKNEFVQIVSHDLKNPINAILLAAELLEKAGELNDQQKQMRQTIIDTSYYMSELISELLDLGKIEAGVGLKMEPINLPAFAQEINDDLAHQAEAKELALTLEAPKTLMITGDKERLRQVLLNLVGNAIKYTPSGSVQVVITVDGKYALVQVIDTGLGMPAEAVPHIFDKFYRVESESHADIKGTGLGLAIVKSVIEAHDGRIWVESEVGQGSTFTFTLPLKVA